MKKLLCILPVLLLLGVLMPRDSRAQDRIRNAAERAADHRELRQDRRQLTDDLRDAARLESLLGKHREAGRAGDHAALASIHEQVKLMLAAETSEAAREAAQAKAELRRSNREVRGDRREIRSNKARSQTGATARKDRRDLRDDRRDRRDDRRDAAGEQSRHQRYLALGERWNTLQPGGDVQAHQEVLEELLTLARTEVLVDGAEAREDRRELREDRRESREDRRQR